MFTCHLDYINRTCRLRLENQVAGATRHLLLLLQFAAVLVRKMIKQPVDDVDTKSPQAGCRFCLEEEPGWFQSGGVSQRHM